MALLYGINPLAYLGSEDTQLRVLNRVVERAQELDQERKKYDREALAHALASRLAKMFG